MPTQPTPFQKPSRVDQFFNKMVGRLADWGIGPSYMQVLEVAGRKSGKLYRTPVNLMEVNSDLFLVAPRGETSWVRNARHSGTIVLKRGSKRVQYRIHELPRGQKAALLQEYLQRYTSAVQRYFSVKAGSDLSAFTAIEDQHPVLQLLDS